ncbi:MAG TPA: hypothetical protein VKB66_00415 [Candidatus Acidoferrum sp.]|nr:hypothetical protein [Candidatus Acidoferrum sp.]
MPDWQELVRQRLTGLELDAAEREDVQMELAAHLEESYGRFLQQGLTEKEASHRTIEQVSDWQELRLKIDAAKRREQPMKKRTQQLWIPGFLTLILSVVALATLQKSGWQPHIASTAPNTIFFFVPWLLLLPFLGAFGAYVSSRAGGSRGTALLASCFPVPALTGAFLSMFPIGMIIEWVRGSQGDFSKVGATLLKDGVGWLLFPGVALLAGGLLRQLLFGQRSASPNATIR